MTQSTLGHHLEQCSLEQWAQVMCPKGAKNTKHNTQPTAWQIWTAKNFTWRNYVRKSRIARLMWLRGASQFLFLGQDGSRWHNPSPGVQALLISVCHGERTPETVGWPKAHLDTTSNHAPWNSEPKSCAWRVPKHWAKNFTWRNYVRKSRIARLMVPRWPISVPWTKWIKMAQPFTRCPGPTYLSMPWWKDTWDRWMTQSTLGHHLEPCSLEQWTQVMCLKGAKNTDTKHKHIQLGRSNCQKLHLEKLRSEIKNSPVDVAPR